MNWSRVVMYRAAKQMADEFGFSQMRALEVGPSDASFWAKEIKFINYNCYNHSEVDICGDAVPEMTFDMVIMDNVLEHVIDPRKALKNARSILRPEGYLFIATPFLVRVHQHPIDMHRWTRKGLRMLLEEAGFYVEDCDSWGNAACVTANFAEWVKYDHRFHSLDNDPELPIMVWALARKTEPSPHVCKPTESYSVGEVFYCPCGRAWQRYT